MISKKWKQDTQSAYQPVPDAPPANTPDESIAKGQTSSTRTINNQNAIDSQDEPVLTQPQTEYQAFAKGAAATNKNGAISSEFDLINPPKHKQKRVVSGEMRLNLQTVPNADALTDDDIAEINMNGDRKDGQDRRTLELKNPPALSNF